MTSSVKLTTFSSHSALVTHLRERMGSEATEAEAEVMFDLLEEAGFIDGFAVGGLGRIRETEWNDWIREAVACAADW